MPRFTLLIVLALAVGPLCVRGEDVPIEQFPCAEPEPCYHVGGLARGYYINDQRITFTGLEETFAVEGVVDGGVHHQVGDWLCQVEGELFLTQPYDRNRLVDTPL